MRSPFAAIVVVTSLALAGCASPGAVTVGANLEQFEGQWLLVSASDADGPLALSDGIPTISNDGGEWGGTSPCNSFGADVSLEPVEGESEFTFRLKRTMSTEVYCDGEQPFIEALESASRATLGSDLSLSGADVLLRFERLEPVDEQNLIGRWTLESAEVDGVATPSDLAWIEFTPSLVSGSSGCRDFDGKWMVRGAVVHLDSFKMTGDGACADEAAEIESAVMSVLGDGFRVTVNDTLTVTSHRFEGTLVFTRG